jgi:hypothetical protein
VCLSVYQVRSRLQGLARTQIPTNKNDDVEFPTFGDIAGVNHSLVQWSSLALEEPPSWSWLTSRPGKYASSQGLQKFSDVVFLTPHLSPADLSPVLTMKRKLWNIFMENQSFHEQWLLETARNIVLQSDSDHLLQENGFNATNTPPVGCEWHYDITLIVMCQSDSQFWPLLWPTATSLKSSSVEHPSLFEQGWRST